MALVASAGVLARSTVLLASRGELLQNLTFRPLNKLLGGMLLGGIVALLHGLVLNTFSNPTLTKDQLQTAAQGLCLKDRGVAESTSSSASLWGTKVQWRLNFSGSSFRKLWHVRAPVVCLSQQVIPKYLIGKTYRELESVVCSCGGQKYRAKQLHHLIYQNKARTLQECAQLPKELRKAMESEGWSIGRSSVHHVVTSIDGTVKILLRLEDSRVVEVVGIPVSRGSQSRLTACVSSQVGCALKCSFCATGKGGLGRNLQAHEIIDQVLAIQDLFRQPVTNVAFMGMGEPLKNLGAVVAAHQAITKVLKIPQTRMKISTVGVPNTIRRLAAHKLHSKLVVSLHASNQELRSELVPSAKRYPLDVLMEDCKFYYETNYRRLSFDYTLLGGVNDHEEQAEDLATLLHHWNFSHVNLTPYNPIPGSDFGRPSKAKVLGFVEALVKREVTASLTTARGLDASAAHGQLWNEHQKVPLQSPIVS